MRQDEIIKTSCVIEKQNQHRIVVKNVGAFVEISKIFFLKKGKTHTVHLRPGGAPLDVFLIFTGGGSVVVRE